MIKKLVKGNLASPYEIAEKLNELVDWANDLQKRFDEVKTDREARRTEKLTDAEFIDEVMEEMEDNEIKVGDRVWAEYAMEWQKGKVVDIFDASALVKLDRFHNVVERPIFRLRRIK